MAVMGGLVEISADRIDDSHPSIVGEWMARNIFVVVLGGCTLFWAAVIAIVTAL